jgi:hypothetical protein
MRLALAFALMLAACSASEDANRGIHCDLDTLCPDTLICYRNFCIPHDVPHEVFEAGVSTPSAEAGVLVDATVDVSPDDAEVDAAVPVAEDAGQVPPTVEDAGSLELDAEAALPELDSGAVVDDAARPSSAALLVCLPSCSNRSPACLRCLRGVLADNPTLCSDANAELEPVVAGLCEYLCTNAACEAEP